MSASASKKKRKELEEQGLSPRDIAAQEEKEQKQKTLRNVLIVALCVLVAAAAIFAVISLTNRPTYDTKAAVVTVGDEKINVPIYNIFYAETATTLSNYGIIQPGTSLSQQSSIFGEGTMEDYCKDSTNAGIEAAYNYYIKAKEAGYELSAEDKDAISQQIDSLKTAAKNYGFSSVKKLLSANYGKGCTLSDYETYLKVNAIYTGYYNKLQEEFEPSAEELQSAYDKDHSAYDQVNYTYMNVTAESTSIPADDAEAGKSEGEDSTDPTDAAETPTQTVYSDEAKAIAKETADSYAEEMPEDAKTALSGKSEITSSLGEEIANWLFEAERKEGDVHVFAKDEDGISYCTVRFDGLETNEYKRVNANIITITKDAEDAQLEEGQQSAKDKFDALIKAVEDGMSDEAFAEAASALGYTVSTTPVSKTYSNADIRGWLYEEGRKAGDLKTDIETDATYYVVRYVGLEEASYRDTMIKSSLWNDLSESIRHANEIAVVEDMMQYANTDLTFRSSNSSEG